MQVEEVLQELNKPFGQKTLNCKWLYDHYGSEVFEKITRCRDYYLTRAEFALLQEFGDDIADEVLGLDSHKCGPLSRAEDQKNEKENGGNQPNRVTKKNECQHETLPTVFLEYGSGSSAKTLSLLDRLRGKLAGFVPIDISGEFLQESAALLKVRYGEDLPVTPVVGDFTKDIELPADLLTSLGRQFQQRVHCQNPNYQQNILSNNRHQENHQEPTISIRKVAFFAGSTIGNFHPDEAISFLRRVHKMVGSSGGLLIGVDLVKDPAILHLAYNDRDGLTADFTLHVLERLRDELGSDIDVSQFQRHSFYNVRESRIEAHVIAQSKVSFSVGGTQLDMEEGESIWCESSYKYTIARFAKLAQVSGFVVRRTWTHHPHDQPNPLYAMFFLVPSSSHTSTSGNGVSGKSNKQQ